MNDKFRASKTFQRLREKAEQLIQEKDVEAQAADRNDIMQLAHELEIHSVELELQNDELRRAKAELESSREEFFDLWESSPVPYVVLSRDHTIQNFNKAAHALLGGIRKPGPGTSFLLWVHSEDRGGYDSFMKELARDREAGPVDLRLRGTEHPFHILMEGVAKFYEKTGLRYRLALVDITERKHVEQKLRENEARLRLALRAGQMGVWDRIPKTREAIWNGRMFELYGRDPDASAPDTEDYFKYIHKDDLPRVRTALEETLRSGIPLGIEFRIIREDGETRWLASYGIQVGTRSEKPFHITGVNFDITERKRAEQILKKYRDGLEHIVKERTAELEKRNREQKRTNRQLGVEIEKRKRIEADLRERGESLVEAYQQREFLARKLVSLLEEERRNIGSTLHDDLGQVLAGVSLKLEGLVRSRGRRGDAEFAESLESIQDMIRDAIKRARSLSHSLRSDSLERFGLVAALKDLVVEMEGNFEKGIHLFVKNLPEHWGNSREGLTVYRVAQEGLTNALKHAQATEVFINLNQKDGCIIFTIEDNGVGFDYDNLPKNPRNRLSNAGLIIMRERVVQTDGTFHIESHPGRGTQIIVHIPL